MTRPRRTARRSRRLVAALLAAAPLALSVGCTTAPKFASGRMPYDGGSEHDPFRTAPSFERTAAADRPGTALPSGPATAAGAAAAAPAATADWSNGPQPPAFASQGSHPPAAGMSCAAALPAGTYQAGYRQPAADPFGEVAASPADAGNPFAPSAVAAAPVTPAGYQTAAASPFAELNAAPAAASAGSHWTSRPQTTAAIAAEEFLPPVR